MIEPGKRWEGGGEEGEREKRLKLLLRVLIIY